MTRTRIRAAAFIAALGLAGHAAAATIIPDFTISGRVAVSEPHTCDGGMGDLTRTDVVTWPECHALKEHMDDAGEPITVDAFDEAALRPLSVTVQIDVYCSYDKGAYADAVPARTAWVQTGKRGEFEAAVLKSTCGQPVAADGVIVLTTAWLKYEMTDAAGVAGTVRAIWEKSRGMSVYTSTLSASEPVLYSAYGEDFVIPRFVLQYTNLALPMPARVDIGNQTFFAGAAPYFYDYLRGALGTWQTVVMLHRKLKAELAVDGHDGLYRDMFIDEPSLACARCYSVYFDNAFGGGVGGAGGFSIDRPTPSVSMGTYGSLVSVGLPAHEFGHSMHGTIARGSFGPFDDTMYYSLDSLGRIGGYHTGYVATGAVQQQELGMAFLEGFGDAMGAYFLNGCRIRDRGWGDPDPLRSMWNVAGTAWCDPGDQLCPYSSFRLQMSRRGIAEGSATWNARLSSLTGLFTQAATAGAMVVTSNNEYKYRAFLCDLLDTDDDVSFASGQVGGKTYVPDLMWHAAERLDGRAPPVTFATYGSDPAPERVRMSLGRLLTAMNAFAPAAYAYPPVIPEELWRAPTITDGAQGAYNDMRISVNGVLSAQSLGRYMVGAGYLTRDELNNVLRANRMEEVP